MNWVFASIPNALTILRLGLIVPFVFFFAKEHYVSAFLIFLTAGITDALDGWLARAFRWQTSLGSFLDPLADKLLVAASFVALAIVHILPWWLVVLVFMRDATISFGVLGWFLVIKQPITLRPTILSKLNTVIQLGLVSFCLYERAFEPALNPIYQQTLIGLTTLSTLASYLHYVWVWSYKAKASHAKIS